MQEKLQLVISKLKENKKWLFIAVGLVVLLEVFWAWQALAPKAVFSPPAPPKKVSQAVIALSSSKPTVKSGESFTVNINFSSSKKSDGSDIALTYDPQSLQVISNSGNPVQVGTLYSDYPLNTLDSALGHISVSGITSQEGGVSAQGLFGSLVFQALKPGRTKIIVDFTAGSTTDSNITENKTAKDILGRVENLEVNIIP